MVKLPPGGQKGVNEPPLFRVEPVQVLAVEHRQDGCIVKPLLCQPRRQFNVGILRQRRSAPMARGDGCRLAMSGLCCQHQPEDRTPGVKGSHLRWVVHHGGKSWSLISCSRNSCQDGSGGPCWVGPIGLVSISAGR